LLLEAHGRAEGRHEERARIANALLETETSVLAG
jgi:hypothetical protein